jgi:hypothetical protein
MAQTITLQRGQITSTSATTTLLFTNSATGTATRLIVGYLSYLATSNDTDKFCNFGIRRSGASSGTEAVFASSSLSAYGRGGSFSPHDTATQSIVNTVAQTNNSAKSFVNGLLGAPVSSNDNANPRDLQISYYNNTTMIGPSDAVYCYYASATSISAVIQYCFILITES